MVSVGAPLPASVAEAPVLDSSGRSRMLGSIVAGRPAVVLFLRQFGCIACAEQVGYVAPRLHELADLDVDVVLVGNGDPQFIDAFVERRGLSDKRCIVVTDPTLAVFDAAGFVRSRSLSVGPRAMWSHARALLRGYRNRLGEGDPWQQGGAIVVNATGEVAYARASRYRGDHVPDVDLVDAALRVAAGARSAPGLI